MAKKSNLRLWLIAAIGLVIIALTLLSYRMYFIEEYIDPQRTFIFGQDRFVPGSLAALRVLTLDYKTSLPVKDARVNINLEGPKGKTFKLFSGKTVANGTLDAGFKLPELPEGKYKLMVQTRSKLGKDMVERRIALKRMRKILLNSDKPVYQPGQTIHTRALALEQPNLKPADGEKLTIEIEDPKGNKVFKKAIQSSEYGIAAANFKLAEELNLGQYTIKASLGDAEASKKVTVKKYVLPKFKIDLSLDKNYYMPGQTIHGKVQCDYFFGKPVSLATVRVKLETFVERFVPIAQIQGSTDANGSFEFDYTLPSYFVGLELGHGKALLKFDIEVTDRANHKEAITRTLHISKEPIDIRVIPESGELVPGVENMVWLVTSYPDGSPAACKLEIAIKPANAFFQASTNQWGIAEHKFSAAAHGNQLEVRAWDLKGNKTQKSILLGHSYPIFC